MSENIATLWDAPVSARLLQLALAEGLAISAEHAEVVAVLLRHGAPMTHARLRYAINAHRPPASGALYERVSLLRDLFGRDFIGGFKAPEDRQVRVVRGCRFGAVEYSLSAEGVDICGRALERVAAKLVLRPIEPQCAEQSA